VRVQKLRQEHIRSKVIDNIADDDFDDEETEPQTDEAAAPPGSCTSCEGTFVTLGAKLKGLDFDALRSAIPINETFAEQQQAGSAASILTRQTLVDAGLEVRALPTYDKDSDDGRESLLCSVCKSRPAN